MADVGVAGAWWDRRAAGWSAPRDRIDQHLDIYGAVARRRLAATGGEWILDAGCGPGLTLRALADRVGPQGRLRGVDLSPLMVRTARQRCADLPWVDVDVADLGSDDLGGPWNGIYARFALMLVDDPGAALANIHRFTRHGGRLAFTTWAPLEDNPWRWAPSLAARTVLGHPLALPEYDPTPLSTAEQIGEALAATGWTLSSLERVAGARTAASRHDLAGLLEEGGPLADRWQQLTADQRARLLDEIEDRLANYRSDGGYCFPGSAWVVLATR